MQREREVDELRAGHDLVEEVVDPRRAHAHLERERVQLRRQVAPAEIQAWGRLGLPGERREVREEVLARACVEDGEHALRERVERLDVRDAAHAFAVCEQPFPVVALGHLGLHDRLNRTQFSVP